MRTETWIGWAQDIRYAVRALLKNPSFAAIALVTLSVGVGANTAIFSVLHAVVLQDLPYREADRLAMLWTFNTRQNLTDGSSYLNFRDWKEQSRAFVDMSVYRKPDTTRATIGNGDDTARIHTAMVDSGFFRVLSASPRLGRTIGSRDVDAAQRVAVISHRLWRQRFAEDSRVIGRSLNIDGVAWEIVGVMGPDFQFPTAAVDLWQPISVLPIWKGLTTDPIARDADMLFAVGRLSPGVTMTSASIEMNTIAARLRDAYPEINEDKGILVEPLVEYVLGKRTGLALWMVFGAVTFLLLITCANLANLVLLRVDARRSEFSVRSVMGATRARLLRQALSESLVLSAIASAGGLLLAWVLIAVLRLWAASALPRLDTVGLNGSVLVFGFAVAFACGLLAALLPTLQFSRGNPGEVLREGGTRATSGQATQRIRRALVVAELSLSVVLLAGAGLMLRSFERLQASDLGFDSERLVLLRVDLPRTYNNRARRLEYFDATLERVRALPGVTAAGAIGDFFIERNADQRISIEGAPTRRPGEVLPSLTHDRVLPGYFEATRTRLVRGRALTNADLVAAGTPGGPFVAVINEELARRFWPGEDAIGKRFKNGENPGPNAAWINVVGIVADMRRRSLDERAIPFMFTPGVLAEMDVVVRTAGDPDALRDPIVAAFRAVDPATIPYDLANVEQQLWGTVALRTLQTVLLAALAGAAFLLAIVGIYGITRQSVAARTREIGIRMALGADAPDVLRMVLRQVSTLTAVGLGLGLFGAIALQGTLSSFLYETSALDPLTYAAVIAVFIVVTMVTCITPAWRAARIEPVVALHAE